MKKTEAEFYPASPLSARLKELQLTVLVLTDDNISNSIWFGAHQLGNFSCDVGELPLGHHPDWRDGENYGGEGFYR